MKRRMKIGLATAGFLTASMAGAALAQTYLDPKIAYSYDYYADAEKTQYLGTTVDTGCVVSGHEVYAQRVNIPSPYYDATPMYMCSGVGPWLPPDW